MQMVILMVVFFGLMILGVPIPASLGFALYQDAIWGGGASLGFIGRTMIRSMDSFPLLAVPMFILAGEIMGRGGISKKMFDLANSMIGRMDGGLPVAAVLTSFLFGAISGSGVATFAAVGALMIPLLVKQGYDVKFVTGLTATAGGLGVILPPSLPMVMFAVAANESIGDMFIAGIVPGVIAGIALMAYAYIYCKRNKIPPLPDEMKPLPLRKTFRDGFLALLTPAIILGGIYSGFFTATEAAAVSVVYAIIISKFFYKSIRLRDLPKYLLNAAALTGPMLIIISLATVFGRTLTFAGVPGMLSQAILSISENRIVILILVNIVLLIIGLFMDTISAIVILTPLVLPIAQSIGMDPVHLGVIMIVNKAIGLVTPPVGLNLFVASAMTKIPITQISKAAVGPIVALLIALLLITAVPALSTGLVNLLR